MTERLSIFFLSCFLLAMSFPAPGSCQVSVTTQRYDNARTGQNLSEKILNTSTVNPAGFGKLFSRTVDDQVYAQPLIVTNVRIPNLGTRNALYVATVNNSVYAFDADDPDTAAPLWHVNLTPSAPAARPVGARDVGQRCGLYRNFTDKIGLSARL